MNLSLPKSLWSYWLLTVSVLIVIGGLEFSLVMPYFFPETLGVFYNEVDSSTSFKDLNPESRQAFFWVIQVTGAAMVGWGIVMVSGSLALVRGEKSPYFIKGLALALVSWYLLDTSLSLVAGSTTNAILNTVFLVLTLPPVVGLLLSEHSSAQMN